MWDSKRQILHALHKLRQQGARKTSIVQADSKVTFHTITSSIRLLSRAISLFGLSTLNSHRTNHKPRKKKPFKNASVCPCDSAEFEHDIVHKFADALYRRFRASVTQAIPANPSILGDRLLFYIENTIDTDGSSFYPGCKAIAIKNLLRPPITFRVSNQMNPS